MPATLAERFRVGVPSVVLGTRLVADRLRSESFWVYRPATDRQMDGGHWACLWYFKPVGHEGAAPVSNGYPSPEEAIAALLATQESKDSN